jgi:hypothetical protein
MVSAGHSGIEPDNENDNEFQREEQDEEDRRRRRAQRLHDEPAGALAGLDKEQDLQPARPNFHPGISNQAARSNTPGVSDQQAQNRAGPADARNADSPKEKSPSGWQDTLTERLTKLNETQRREYDRQLYNAMERNGAVSPDYQLDLAALVSKDQPRREFGWAMEKLNRRENEACRVEQAEANRLARLPPRAEPIDASKTREAGTPPASATQDKSERPANGPDRNAAADQKAVPEIRHAVERRRQPPPRQAAPDRTGRVAKRFRKILKEHAEQRRKLKLPMSRAEQNKFAQLQYYQQATRKDMLDRHSAELQLLDCQHAAEIAHVAVQWLARDLRYQGSTDAAIYEKEAQQIGQAAELARDRRQAIVQGSIHPLGWNDAASVSTFALPSAVRDNQNGQRTADPRSVPAVATTQNAVAVPQSPDLVPFLKDNSGALLTEDRLRALPGRYQEVRENRHMPSSPNEENEQSHLATSQAIVRKNTLDRQHNQSQLLEQQHLAEQVGTSAECLGRNTNELRYKAQARRAFAVAKLSIERSDAIDPHAQAKDRIRAAGAEQIHRQAMSQEAAKGGRTLTSEERANLTGFDASSSRSRSARTGERSGGVEQSRGRSSGREGNSRGGGGRGR